MLGCFLASLSASRRTHEGLLPDSCSFMLQGDTDCRKHAVPWPANWVTASPDGGKMLAVVGDDPKGLLLDATSGETIAELAGHLDFSFAAAWHPGGNMLATANQVSAPVQYSQRRVHVRLVTFDEMSGIS